MTLGFCSDFINPGNNNLNHQVQNLKGEVLKAMAMCAYNLGVHALIFYTAPL